MDPSASAEAIDAALQSLGTPERAVSERAYLKSDRLHYGTSLPNVRFVAKAFLKANPTLDHGDLITTCVALWDHTTLDATGRTTPVHDRRMAAVELLDLRPKLLTVADLDLVERFVREASTWALVDTLAGHVAADIVAAEPDVAARDGIAVLDRWVGDDDFWIRRSAVLGLSTLLRGGRELDRFFAYADQLLPEREFFIRKVLGWVARETGRRYPGEVSAWVRRNMAGMNGVTIREAVKHLPDGAEVLAIWTAR